MESDLTIILKAFVLLCGLYPIWFVFWPTAPYQAALAKITDLEKALARAQTATPNAARVAAPFADSTLSPAATPDPGAAVSPGLMRLLQPVTPLDFPPGDPLTAAGSTPTRRGAVITPQAVETANSAIVYRCERDGMVATPLACYLRGFYKAVEDLRKPSGYAVHVSMGLNPEIVAVFPQDPQEKK